MIRLFVFGLMASAVITSLLAQGESEIPPPSPPLVLPLPKMMRVTLLLKEDKPAPEEGPVPAPSLSGAVVTWKSVEVVKTGDIRLITATMTDGGSHDTWVLGGKLFNKTFDGRQVSCGDYQPMFPSFFQTGNTSFYGTDWITLKNYKGVVSFGGKQCYFYESLEAVSDQGFGPGGNLVGLSLRQKFSRGPGLMRRPNCPLPPHFPKVLSAIVLPNRPILP